jgi:hypothetical protein
LTEYTGHIRGQDDPVPASELPSQTPVTAEQRDGQDRGAGNRASAEDAAEPRGRESYASDIRSAASQQTDSPAATDDRPGAAPDTQTQPGPAETRLLTEPRLRDEYAPDLRAASQPDQPASHGPITHYHGEFRGQQIDLYTDGTRWAPGDRQEGENVAGKTPGTSPGDLSGLPPPGDQLVDTAGEDASLAERLRRETYQNSGDLMDVLDKSGTTMQDVFSRPQPSGHDVSPVGGPYVAPAPHYGIQSGDVLSAVFVAGLLADRIVGWLRQRGKRP